MSDYEAWLGPVTVESVPIPYDCTDGFLYAYWQRPRAYLDPRVRAAMSSFWALEDPDPGLARLESDLDSGAWGEKHAAILGRDAMDLGYRLVIARRP